MSGDSSKSRSRIEAAAGSRTTGELLLWARSCRFPVPPFGDLPFTLDVMWEEGRGQTAESPAGIGDEMAHHMLETQIVEVEKTGTMQQPEPRIPRNAGPRGGVER